MSLSVYIHIPYCLRKCPYCDFVSYAEVRLSHEEYVEGVISELEKLRDIGDERGPAATLYIGGGTPSLLDPKLVEKLIMEVRKKPGLEDGAEVTIEVNPGTVDTMRLAGYRDAGVTRISIGVQSMDDESLKKLGRIHSAAENRSAFRAARLTGYQAVSIDLIFGLPGQTMGRWASDLADALSFKPDHVSAYMLKAPEGWEPPDEDTVSEMYLKTVEALESEGLFQYEVSNFARPGRESRHNFAYWTGGSYLGLGASAHSYIAGSAPCGTVTGLRWSNETAIDKYLGRVRREGRAIAHCERITPEMARDEAIMLGLRLREGLDMVAMGKRFGETIREALEKAAGDFVRQGLGELSSGRFRLNPKGMLLCDELAAALASK